MTETQAYPLQWPNNRPRAKSRNRANFHRKVTRQWASGTTYQAKEALTIGQSRDRVMHELELMGASQIVISSNLRLNRDGTITAAQSNPADSGVAVYFSFKKPPHCIACDVWDRAADNLAAIAKHVEAMRGQLRWGAATAAEMFTGFKALPGAVVTAPVMSFDEAMEWVRRCTGIATHKENVQDAFRICAKKLHPDTNGGTIHPDWHVFQAAKQVIENG